MLYTVDTTVSSDVSPLTRILLKGTLDFLEQYFSKVKDIHQNAQFAIVW